MVLRVSGKNFDIGESMRGHVLERIQNCAEKYVSGPITGHVIVDHEGSGYRADCTLHVSRGITLHAEGRGHEPYVSVDQAADRLEKRLRRYKSRLRAHHGERHENDHDNNRGPADAGPLAAHYTLEAPDHGDIESDEAFHPVVVAEKSQTMPILTVSAAVTELDFTGAPVLVFRHAGHGRVNFVYRRSDGHIGWIDPSPLADTQKA
jgi:ribosomal subunit interface protein